MTAGQAAERLEIGASPVSDVVALEMPTERGDRPAEAY
jgi:hypothetical protein